jgi:protein gp37
MAATTIEWTATTGPDGQVHGGFSFNAWVGCERISPACRICYAASWAKRTGHPELWDGERRRTTADYWRQPLKWNAKAAKLGVRLKVFCCSLADVFDNAVPDQWRADLFDLITQTPHLDWLLLTKRIGNARPMLNDVIDRLSGGLVTWDSGPWSNVLIGATMANQAEANRDTFKLLSTPAAGHFISYEPALGPLDLTRIELAPLTWNDGTTGHLTLNALRPSTLKTPALSWLICGGESGPGAVPADVDWFRSLRRQCAEHGVSYFMKQLGGVRDKRGRLEDLPEDLRVREFPST